MKVYFRHSFSRRDFYYTVSNPTDTLSVEEIISKLKHNFETLDYTFNYLSAAYYNTYGKSSFTLYFRFTESADEAAFLLWSNEGVEI